MRLLDYKKWPLEEQYENICSEEKKKLIIKEIAENQKEDYMEFLNKIVLLMKRFKKLGITFKVIFHIQMNSLSTKKITCII